MPKEDKVAKVCVAFLPDQMRQISVFQARMIIKFGKSVSFSKVLRMVIKNGLKTTKFRDFKK